MKVLHYITFLFLMLTAKGYAQNTETHGPIVHFGGKFGGVLTKVTGANIESKRKWGYQLGGYVSIDLIANLGFQGEALYTRSVVLLTQAENTGKQKTILKTWDFPVLLRINAGDAITFNIGPQFSRVISSKGYQPGVDAKSFSGKNISYIAGIELGSKTTGGRVYARYNWNNKDFGSVVNGGKSNQFQFGLLVPLL